MKTKPIVKWGLMLSLILVFIACKDEKPETAEEKPKRGPLGWMKSIIGNFSSQDTIFLDSTYAQEFLSRHKEFREYEKDILRFYADRKNAYAWYEGNRIIEQAGNLYHRVRAMKDDGIGDTIPYLDQFEKLMDRPNRKANRQELELMLTSQYFGLAHQVWKGLDDQATRKNEWYIPRKKISFSAYLDSMLSESKNEFLESEPLNPQYVAMRSALSSYRAIQEANPRWQQIETSKKKFQKGDSGQVIQQIRERLVALGDLKDNNSSVVYDDAMEQGVKRFQQRHGLEPDGIIGKGVLDELNVSPGKRIETILVNMERARWLPVDLSKTDNYLLVNIPEFTLHVYENNKPAWKSNVVVGETVNQTVIFSGMLDHVVFSPHWNIPESIVKEEILPSIEADPDYLEKQNLEITGELNGVPVIRQKPGTENSLGLVKFMFPNTHNIYLHDSPAKHLFNEPVRAYSHGCIRVAEPERLAQYVLRDMNEWNERKIREAMQSGDEKYVNLKTPLPVYLVYFTAWVDDNGVTQFRKDIYNSDPRLARMIYNEGNADITLVK